MKSPGLRVFVLAVGIIFIVLNVGCEEEQIPSEKKARVASEQVSLLLGPNYVVSFQETEGDVFDKIRAMIKSGKGKIRKRGADYLAYSLMDAIVDNYFVIMEQIGERIEKLEEELVSNPRPKTLRALHVLKRETIFIRKSLWPLREVVNIMERIDSPLIKKPTRIYFRDVYDHTIQVIDTLETSRDMLSGMLDIYLSSISNKLNEIMKFLTIVGTIFIPLTFIAGIYGMNFANMPELGWQWGYFAVLISMVVIGIVMMIYFKRKQWL